MAPLWTKLCASGSEELGEDGRLLGQPGIKNDTGERIPWQDLPYWASSSETLELQQRFGNKDAGIAKVNYGR